MGKTRDRFMKIRASKGTFHAKMGTIKDRNGIHLTEASDHASSAGARAILRSGCLSPRLHAGRGSLWGTWPCVSGRSFQPSPARCHLCAPSRDPARPRPGGGGVSAGGLKAPSSAPPSPSPLGANGGVGGGERLFGLAHTQSGKPGGRPLLHPCLSFPTSSRPKRPKTRQAPPQVSESLQVQTLTQLPLQLEAPGPAKAGAPGGGGNCRPREGLGSLLFAAPGLSSPPRAPVPLLRSGLRASSLLI